MPDALSSGRLTGMTGAVIEPAAILQRRVSLKPGESRTVRFYTGLARDDAAARDIIGKYRSLSASGVEGSRQEAVRAAGAEILAAGIAPGNRGKWAPGRSQLLTRGPSRGRSAPRALRLPSSGGLTERGSARSRVHRAPAVLAAEGRPPTSLLASRTGEKRRVKTPLEAAGRASCPAGGSRWSRRAHPDAPCPGPSGRGGRRREGAPATRGRRIPDRSSSSIPEQRGRHPQARRRAGVWSHVQSSCGPTRMGGAGGWGPQYALC